MDKSCYNCIHVSPCRVHSFIFSKLLMDVNHIDYNRKFNKLYTAIADACFYYKENKEDG